MLMPSDSSTLLPNPYYWAGNEPDLLAAWQFNVAGTVAALLQSHW